MNDAASRIARLQGLLTLVASVPPEWIEQAKSDRKKQHEMQPMECRTWAQLRAAWQKAMRWREGLEEVLLVMLAVGISTEQEGDQLYLQVIGVPGNSKTTFCDAMLVSHTCKLADSLTGFVSGYKGAEGDDSDYSFINRINRKTLITPEGDVLMSNPRFKEIMSQQRRMFDGTFSATFKNRKSDMRYDGLRTPWIIAGTPAIMESDEASLGDRFLKVCVDTPGRDEQRSIVRKVVEGAMGSVRRTSNCSPETHMAPDKAVAYRTTGGYLDYMRANAEKLLNEVEKESEDVTDRYMDLGEFTAYLRARPNRDPKKSDVESFRELPSRIAIQYTRLGCCLAAVMNKSQVDNEVLRIVRKVAIDTSRGRMLRLVGMVHDEHERTHSGCYTASLARWSGVSDEKMSETLRFLYEIGVVEHFVGNGPADAHYRWQLSGRMLELWRRVHSF